MPEYIFKSPVQPGDPLWWASTAATAGPGPDLVQAKKAENSVEAVQFNGENILVVSDGGNPEELNGQYSCINEDACMAWIKQNAAGSILLDGRTVKAIHVDAFGKKHVTDVTCTVSDIEQLFNSSSLASDTPDAGGTFAIYHDGANAENSAITTFIRDKAGNPVRAIYGEFILVHTAQDAETNMRVMADLPNAILDAACQDQDLRTEEHSYDPAAWTCANRMTAGMLMQYLSKFPDSAVVHCCGTDQISLHWCPETKALNIDCDSLAELPEYTNHEPARLIGPGE